jgi:tRNA pseudouridine55 synthase
MMPAVTADEEAAAKMRHGMAINLAEMSKAGLVKVFAGQNELIGIAARIAGTLFQPKIVLV